MRRRTHGGLVAASVLLLLLLCGVLAGTAVAERGSGQTSEPHAAGEITLHEHAVVSSAGQQLDGAWRFFDKDDLRYAARDLPAGASMGSAWSPDFGSVPPSWRGRGWFRVRVVVPEPLQGRPLAFAVRFYGPLEIYVDGERVARFGQLDSPPGEAPVVACFHPRIVRVTLSGAAHLIAVRLVNGWARKLARLGYSAGFGLSVGVDARLAEHWDQRWSSVSRLHVLFYGVTMGLALLHFLLFMFYRERPANLFFALAAASIGMLARGIEMTGNSPTASGIVNGNALFNASVAMACIFSQRFYYQIFRDRVPRYYPAFVIGAIAIVGASFWLPFVAVYIYALVSFAEQLITLVRAVVARKRGAAIIGAGGLAAISMTAYTIFVDLGYVQGDPFFFLYGFLALCASMSIYLAREIAADKRTLAEQLVEIRRLSQQTLEREREAAEERLARDAAAAANKQRELQLAEARKRKAAVDALDRANEELARAQVQLVQTEKMASLGELVDGVAREIDEPVASIVTRAEQLRRAHGALGQALERVDEAREDRRLRRSLVALTEAARVIEDGGQRVAAIAERLAQFARVDAPQNETLSVQQLVDEAAELLEPRFAAAGVELERDGLADAPRLTGHRRQLVVLLRQLLENALQAVGERDGAGRVSVRASAADDRTVEIAVSDDGPGVRADDRPRIFDPGFTTRGVGVGAGLGLAIAYRVARAHGGDLRLDEPLPWPGDRSPAGASFVVVLPAADAGDAAAGAG